MSKYSICFDCYFNYRAPVICESCFNGSEFEPDVGDDAEMTSGSGSKKVKPVKVHRKKDFQ